MDIKPKLLNTFGLLVLHDGEDALCFVVGDDDHDCLANVGLLPHAQSQTQ
jgi:hypothetical protein